ncbi:LysR family transcriptional regulator [Pseudomonas sp. XWY-1]|uniref:LysR family transcriptional regulator n=1 Tax=Pseudomonas sp. XWY-1 TaxID=2069256 RepID=UPI000CF4C5B9|nr:LysR family transcriptional regulator [Pseudomonas sp. XWY-1]
MQGITDLGPLRSFIEVVRQGGFTHASKVLGITQATVSKHVALLENKLGFRLLIRYPRKVILTDSGNVVYSRGIQLLSLNDDLILELNELADVKTEKPNIDIAAQGCFQHKIQIDTSNDINADVIHKLMPLFLKQSTAALQAPIPTKAKAKQPTYDAVSVELPFGEQVVTLNWPASDPDGCARCVRKLLQYQKRCHLARC